MWFISCTSPTYVANSQPTPCKCWRGSSAISSGALRSLDSVWIKSCKRSQGWIKTLAIDAFETTLAGGGRELARRILGNCASILNDLNDRSTPIR
jgi:hypothetical protein